MAYVSRRVPIENSNFGNIDGAVRQEQGWQQYGRWPELGARLEHPCPTTSAFYIHCNSSGSCCVKKTPRRHAVREMKVGPFGIALQGEVSNSHKLLQSK